MPDPRALRLHCSPRFFFLLLQGPDIEVLFPFQGILHLLAIAIVGSQERGADEKNDEVGIVKMLLNISVIIGACYNAVYRYMFKSTLASKTKMHSRHIC